MIVEYIRYEVPPDRVDALLEAYRLASRHLDAAPECLRYEVERGVEEPSKVVVRIEWTSVEAHEHSFRGGPHFPPFLELVRPFIPLIREMKHYRPIHPGPTAPTLSEWLGGAERLRAVVERFYGVATSKWFADTSVSTSRRRSAGAGSSSGSESADACGVPDDPEFRSALVGYLEWGSRLAVLNSELEETPAVWAPTPRWGWGEVRGPYTPKEEGGAGTGS
ncbi:MAG: antibiotic biosynthesis monooxygenase [Polyangiaceae bacterium]